MLYEWAIKHGVSHEALEELLQLFIASAPEPSPAPAQPYSEAAVQNLVRMEASNAGCRLWRNNVGAARTEDGGIVRYGLANDSKIVNSYIKSSDLIGIRPVKITTVHVGCTIGQFVAREVKGGNWTYKGTKREEAQLRFIQLVAGMGGDACFANGEGTI